MLGNWIDLIIIFLVLMSFWTGIRQGVVCVLLSFLSFSFAFAVALFTYHFGSVFFTANFQLSESWANILAFFLNILVLKLAFIQLFKFILKKTNLVSKIKVSIWSQLAGGVSAVFYMLFTVLVLLSITISMSLPSFMSEEIKNSTYGKLVEHDIFFMNDNLSNIFGNVLGDVMKELNFLVVDKNINESVDLDFKLSEYSVREDLENKMLEKVNQERLAANLRPLEVDEEARALAREYGKYLFENGVFSHTDLEGRGPSDRMEEAGIRYIFSGENLALAPNLDEAHEKLMASKGHRENILHPFFGRVGIGVIDGGDFGIIFVQEFLD